MTPELKDFPTLTVCGVVTGIVLEEGGMGGIQAVMDHLYPGIMTIGCAAMMPRATEALFIQLPRLKKLIDGFGDIETNWQQFALLATETLGEKLPVSGPLKMTDKDYQEAQLAIQQVGSQLGRDRRSRSEPHG